MVTLAVITVEDVTDEELIVYGISELLVMLKFIPDTKFVPSMDKVLGTEDATIPLGVIESIVGVVLPARGVELPPPPPQETSPIVRVARPTNSPVLNK